MKTNLRQHVRYLLKIPGIIRSEHDAFLPGNIAKRGVIETISRKAISPLATQNLSPTGISPFFGSSQQSPYPTGVHTPNPSSIVLLTSLSLFLSLLLCQIVSDGQEPKADTSLLLQEAVVTGNRVPVNRNNVPMNITVVGREEIENSSESALLPVLSERVPGLFVSEQGVTGFSIAELPVIPSGVYAKT